MSPPRDGGVPPTTVMSEPCRPADTALQYRATDCRWVGDGVSPACVDREGIMQRHESIETVVIGAGQAGLSVGYHLARRGAPFVILEANARIGDTWRRRWDSLRLFTPARFDGLAGMPFPASPNVFPTKDDMADYLEAYAARFALPVRTGMAVERVTRLGRRISGDRRRSGDSCRAGRGGHGELPEASCPRLRRRPRRRSRPTALDRLSASEPAPDRRGAGGRRRELGRRDRARARRAGQPVWLSGRDTGEIPFRIGGTPRASASRGWFCAASFTTCSRSAPRSDAGPVRRSCPKAHP